MAGKWKYAVKLYGPNGNLVLHTVHSTKSSKETEVIASKKRLNRGELLRVETYMLIDPYDKEIFYPTVGAA